MEPRKLFHELVDLREALRRIFEYVHPAPVGVEEVETSRALGRVLAEDVYAPIDYPPFDRSEVDGYAVKSASLVGAEEWNPVELRVVGSVGVGEEPRVEVVDGTAVEIATGAAMPRGADAVVMEEFCERRNGFVIVKRSVVPRENVHIAGTDIARGSLVLSRGTRIGFGEVAVLTALGIGSVKVFRKPRIAVFSTGNELVEPGEPLSRVGLVYDVNRFSVSSFLKSLGADPHPMGVLPDDVDVVAERVDEACKRFDMVVVSGGTSAGLGDVVYRALERLGKILFHGLKTKPGKPTLAAVVNSKLVLALPGFPFSAMCIALHLLKPVVEAMMGLATVEEPGVRATLVKRVWKPIDRSLFLPVVIKERGAEALAYPLPFRSGSVSPLILADGIALLEERSDYVDKGSRITVKLLRRPSRMLVVGSNDIALNTVLRDCGVLPLARVVSVGSTEGLRALAEGVADVAPTHLLDEETGVYNTPFLERMGLRGRAVLVKGWRRRLVLAYAPGNPKNIRGFEDLLREDVLFVNRNRGSGTRVFIDAQLRSLAKRLGMEFRELVKKVRGYELELPTHTAVAAAIAHGRADAGVCVEAAAAMYGLSYVELGWEEYDFAVSTDSLDNPAVRRFLEYLRDRGALRSSLSKFVGYEPHPRSGEVVWP